MSAVNAMKSVYENNFASAFPQPQRIQIARSKFSYFSSVWTAIDMKQTLLHTAICMNNDAVGKPTHYAESNHDLHSRTKSININFKSIDYKAQALHRFTRIQFGQNDRCR